MHPARVWVAGETRGAVFAADRPRHVRPFRPLPGERRPAARAVLESAMFENYEYRSELFRSLVNQGRAEGEAQGVVRGKIEGKIEGRIEGKIEGEVLGLRTAIVEVLRRRQIPIDEPAQNQLAAITDAPTLMRFLNRAVTASTLDEVLKD
jgi:hypothetical protein